MKIAVLADIHSNLPALIRVIDDVERWSPDLVIVNGDTVNRGPRPLACLRVVQAKAPEGWQILLGNHEEYVISRAAPDDPRSGPLFDIFRNSFWTYQKLEEDVSGLRAMPLQASVAGPDGSVVRVRHASMRGSRDGIYPETTDEEMAEQIAPAPAVFVTSHTHRPLVRRLNGTLVVNTGSVGAPFDGDHRAGYARLTWRDGRWRAAIRRLDYPWRETARDFATAGFLDGGGPLARIMLLELEQARPHLHLWIQEFLDEVENGRLSLEASVERYLARSAP